MRARLQIDCERQSSLEVIANWGELSAGRNGYAGPPGDRKDGISSRRVHNHIRFPSHRTSLHFHSTLHSTYFPLRDDNRKPGVHTCRILYLPSKYSLHLCFEVIVRPPNGSVKTSGRATHNDCSLSFAKIQNHGLIYLNRVLLAVNANYHVFRSTGRINEYWSRRYPRQ